MKKIVVTFFSLIIAVSFSAVNLAANDDTPRATDMTGQIILSEEEPAPAAETAPAPDPVPEPAPEYTPVPAPEPAPEPQ